MFLRIALLTAVLFVLIWGGFGLLAWRTYHAGKYPNATTVDTGDVWRASPSLFFKRVESYRSTDPFNLIYNWYSRQFDLGPERFANGNCLLMARSSTLLGPLNLNASVMVCNTAADRMNEDAIAAGNPRPVHQGIPCGKERLGNRRRLGKCQAGWHRQGIVLVNHSEL